RQAITRAIACKARLVRLPVHMVERIDRIRRARETIEQRTGHAADVTAIASLLAISEVRVRRALTATEKLVAIDCETGDEEVSAADRHMLRDTCEAPEDFLMQATLRQALEKVLGTLNPMQSRVLCLRHGLSDDGKSHTLEEIGRVFGLTRERIRQIEDQALRKLNHPSRAKMLHDLKGSI